MPQRVRDDFSALRRFRSFMIETPPPRLVVPSLRIERLNSIRTGATLRRKPPPDPATPCAKPPHCGRRLRGASAPEVVIPHALRNSFRCADAGSDAGAKIGSRICAAALHAAARAGRLLGATAVSIICDRNIAAAFCRSVTSDRTAPFDPNWRYAPPKTSARSISATSPGSSTRSVASAGAISG